MTELTSLYREFGSNLNLGSVSSNLKISAEPRYSLLIRYLGWKKILA